MVRGVFRKITMAKNKGWWIRGEGELGNGYKNPGEK